MTKINQLFEEAVSSPPPSRLTARGVLGVVAARRRRVTAAIASVTLAAGAVAVAIGVNLTGGGGHPPAAVAPPGPLVWAGRGDPAHLYRVTNICGRNPRMEVSAQPSTGPGPAGSACDELWASADGGASWSSRGVMEAASLRVVGPLTLLRSRPPGTVSSPPTSGPAAWYDLSTDGGVTWAGLPPDGPPLGAVPSDGVLVARLVPSLWVFDPALGVVRALPGPSWSYTREPLSNEYGHSGTLWFGGSDPATGRLAVVVARAGDVSWTPRLLPNVAPIADPGSAAPVSPTRSAHILELIADADGRPAYVTVFDSGVPQPTAYPAISGTPYAAWLRGFHTTDGGVTWQEVGDGASVPGSRQAWVTADGRLVLLVELDDPAGGDVRGRAFVVGGPDGGFTMADPPGLPTDLLTVDGAVAYTDHALYVSDDGWTWREVWHD